MISRGILLLKAKILFHAFFYPLYQDKADRLVARWQERYQALSGLSV
ncbi:MAG TPA: hypothetical protein VKY40_05465 [Halanaerobiales bacterium]|nr:hypothetical protein [Halanaerobiales bacterium]